MRLRAMLMAVFAFLFGWLVGDSARSAHNSALPETVKQQRYDAALVKREARQERRSWSNPNNRIALVIFAAVVFVTIVVKAVA